MKIVTICGGGMVGEVPDQSKKSVFQLFADELAEHGHTSYTLEQRLEGQIAFNSFKTHNPNVIIITTRTCYESIIAAYQYKNQINKNCKLVYVDVDLVWDERQKYNLNLLLSEYKCDYALFSCLGVAEMFKHRQEKICWFPEFYDPTFWAPSISHYRSINHPGNDWCWQEHGISFIGNADKNRLQTLVELAKNKVYVDTYGISFNSPIDNSVHGHYFAETVLNYKINLGLSRGLVHIDNGRFATSDRLYRVLGCGGFYLCPPVKDLDLLFEDRKHLVMHDGSAEDIKEKALYYMSNNEERKEIAQAGQEEVMQKHTISIRAKQFLDLIENDKTPYFNELGGLKNV